MFKILTTILFAFLLCFVSALDDPMKDPEIAPEVAKIKTKFCDANARPNDTQWTDIEKCSGEDKDTDEEINKFGELMKNCTDLSKDVSSLLANDLRKDLLTYSLCSDQFKACEVEQIEKMIGEAEKNGNKISDQDQKAMYEKGKKSLIDVVTCMKKALGIE